jgi:hypothetical protein
MAIVGDYTAVGGALLDGEAPLIRLVGSYTASGGIQLSGYDGDFAPRDIILEGDGYLYRALPALTGGSVGTTSYYGYFDSPSTAGPEFLEKHETLFSAWGADSVYTFTFGAKVIPGAFWSTTSSYVYPIYPALFTTFVSDYEGSFAYYGTVRVRICAQFRTIEVYGNGFTVETEESLAVYDESTIVVHFDSSDATAENRVKIFLNGTECTYKTTSSYPAQEYELWYEYDPSNYGYIFSSDIDYNTETPGYSGYVREAYYLDGLLIAPSTLYPTEGTYSGSFGARGFYLKFDNDTALGEDSSPNGNDLTNGGVDLVTRSAVSSGGSGFTSTASGSRFSFRTEAYLPSTVSLNDNAVFAFEEEAHTNSVALQFDGTSAALKYTLSGTKGASFEANTASGIQAISSPNAANLTTFTIYLEVLTPSTRTIDWDTLFSSRDRFYKYWSDPDNSFCVSFSATTREVCVYNYDSGIIDIDAYSVNEVPTDQLVTIIVSVDTTQATESDRLKIYIDGTLDVDSGSNYPALNSTLRGYSDEAANFYFLGLDREADGGSNYPFEGNIYRAIFVSGQALEPSDFSGGYSGTHGTYGFQLEFTNPSQLGLDSSDNGIDFAVPPLVTPITSELFNILTTTTVSTDTWTSIGLDFDSSRSTSSDRVKIFIGDTVATIAGGSTYPTLGFKFWNDANGVFSSPMFKIGSVNVSGIEYGYEGQLRNIAYSDGIAIYSPDLQYSFTGPYGNVGWHLKFLDSEDPGIDSSPNDLYFISENIAYSPYAYGDIYSLGVQGITFELLRGSTSELIGMSFRLYSGETTTPTIQLEITAQGYDIDIPLVLYGSGESVAPTVAFTLFNTEDYVSGTAYTSAVWRWVCVLDGTDISDKLFEEVEIEQEEDASGIAYFYFIPVSGVIDPLVYVGKSVVLSWKQFDNTGAVVFEHKRFTGNVADVEWNPDTRTIRVSADTQLPAKFNAMPKDTIASFIGGMWSDQVWADEDDKSGWTYAQERLSTTTDFVWVDANGALRKDSLLANRVGGVPTPHFTFTDDERFHESLSLEYAQRSEMTNKIQVALTYSYQRKRQRTITFNWNEFIDTDACNFLVNCEGAGMGNYQLCQRSMVESAASSAGWVAITPIKYTPVWPAGAYSCSNPCSTSSGPYSDLYVWNITTVSGFVNGEETTKNPATGEVTQNEGFAYEAAVDASNLCIGATWRSACRWLQDVEENYDLVIKCSDSIEAIGEVSTTEEYSIANEADNSDWTTPLTPFESPSMAGALTIDGSDDKYLNADEDSGEETVTRSDFEDIQEIIISAAKGDIIRAHRLNTLSFRVAYQPTINLSHTVKIDTPYLTAIGKVKSVRDLWSITTGEASTEIQVAISRHNGSGLAVEDPVVPVERPEPTEEPTIPRYVRLRTYKGGRSISAAYDEEAQTEWEGFLTNYLDSMQPADYSVNKVDNPLLANKTYPYSFVVRGPEISEDHTSSVAVIATQEYEVVVPEDTLILTA